MSRRSISLLTAIKMRVPQNAALLVAVSGGQDSIALLDGLVRLKRMLNLRLEIAHVDHGLRTASAQDADFVEQLAKQHELSFHKKTLIKPDGKFNIENWGRKERHSYFKGLLKSRGLDFIVTAHHSNDVTETFLMRLVSNKELRSIHALNKKHRMLRPILSVSKKAVKKHIKKYNLAFREDESNSDSRFLRNKVRHLLLPQLEEHFSSRVTEWIAERARALDSDSRCLDQMAMIAVRALGSASPVSEAFVSSLRAQPEAVGLRMLEFALFELMQYRLGRKRAKLVRRVLLGKASSCDLPDGYRFYWSNGKVAYKKSGDS